MKSLQSLLPLLLLLSCGLSACLPATFAGARRAACGDPLGSYNVISAMNPARVQLEIEQLRAEVGRSTSKCDQLYLAMLLSRPNPAAQDDREALQLLQQFLAQTGSEAQQDRMFARLLQAELQQRSKLKQHSSAIKLELDQQLALNQRLAEQLREAQLKLERLKNIDLNFDKTQQEIATPSTDKMRYDEE